MHTQRFTEVRINSYNVEGNKLQAITVFQLLRVSYISNGSRIALARLRSHWDPHRPTQARHAMGHAQRRFLSIAAKLPSVPLSSLRSFPPEGALATSSSTFSPETWAALQPPPPSALSALSHRIGLGSLLQVPELEQACTHPSVLPFFAQRHPNQKPPPANGNLSTLGNALLGLFASEFVAASYPHLPTRVVKAAVSAYVGPNTCANVAKEVGAAPLLRWHRTVRHAPSLSFFTPFKHVLLFKPPTPLKPPVLHPDALSSIPRSLVALIYQRSSFSSARKFAHQFFLGREVDLRKMLKFRDPKVALTETVAKFGREKPVSRYLWQDPSFMTVMFDRSPSDY